MGNSKTKIQSYKDLKVWKKSYKLSLAIYKTTSKFPKDELYGLVSQMRRSAISIPSNIAEGYARNRKLEYIQYLQIAYASGAELETQTMLARDLNYLSLKSYNVINGVLQEVLKMLNVLIRKLKSIA